MRGADRVGRAHDGIAAVEGSDACRSAGKAGQAHADEPVVARSQTHVENPVEIRHLRWVPGVDRCRAHHLSRIGNKKMASSVLSLKWKAAYEIRLECGLRLGGSGR